MTAIVDDGRLTARLHYPGVSVLAPVLRAQLVQESDGLLIEGEVQPTQLVGLVMWLVVAVVLVGAAVSAVAAGNVWAMGLTAAMVSGLAAVTPGLWRAANRHQQDAVERLEAALRARFAVDE
ncbi:MAG: hypothetical protein R2761_28850 [Acidimicrobiales bacterium]